MTHSPPHVVCTPARAADGNRAAAEAPKRVFIPPSDSPRWHRLQEDRWNVRFDVDSKDAASSYSRNGACGRGWQ